MEQLLQEFSNICRFCVKSHEILKPIFKQEEDEIFSNVKTNPNIKIPKIVEQLFGIKMNISDELPKFICVLCYDKLISSFVFRQQCLLSIKNLKNKLCDSRQKQKQSVKCQAENINNNLVNINRNLNDTQLTIKNEQVITEIVNKEGSNINKFQSNSLRAKIANTKQKNTAVSSKKSNLIEASKKSGKQILPLRVCPICGVTHNRMNAHMERMHSIDGPFECDFCGKIFKAKSYLRFHFKIHLNIRNQKCKLCDKTFVASTSLRVHMLNHTNERKYKCNICNKSYRQSCILGAHMKKHTQERNYLCDFCDQRFFTSHHKKRHEILHSNENPFKCEFCTRSFKTTGSLSFHRVNVHTKLNPYKCEICNETFVRLVDFKTHKRQHEYKII